MFWTMRFFRYLHVERLSVSTESHGCRFISLRMFGNFGFSQTAKTCLSA